jgi:O-antigen/teichoic acid export membrane protein
MYDFGLETYNLSSNDSGAFNLTAETLTPAPETKPRTPGFPLSLGETSRQAGMLFSAQTGSMFAGFFASIILGRWMEPGEMGRLAFCLSIILVSGLIFELGFSSAGARVLALADNRESERQALGGLVLITLAIGVIFALFIAAAAKPIDLIFSKDVRWLLVSTAALSFFQPFQLFIEQSCQGLNQIRRLSVFQLTMSGCYLIGLIGLVITNRLTAGTALAAYLAGIGIASGWALFQMRPSFRRAAKYIRITLSETRGYGFNLYLARISGLASSRSDQLAIGYFLSSTTPLGIYAIAQKFSNPIAMIGRSLATTRFRAFSRLARVPARITKWNTVVVFSASVALVIAGPIVLRFVFPKYSEASSLLIPFAGMNLFVGLFQPYNIFLAAHGRGAELRNIVLITGLATLLGLVFAVPRFGIEGAAWTVAATMALDYVLHLLYYRKFIGTLEPSVNGET